MKKILLTGSLTICLGLTFFSCNQNGHNEMTRTLNASAISIITSIEDGTVYASGGSYSFSLKMTEEESTGTVTSPEIIANNQSLGFTTDNQAYKSTGYDAFFENAKGFAGKTSMELYNANFLALYLYDATMNKYGYYYDTSNVGEYTYSLNNQSPWITVAKYNIGSAYRVNTFPINAFFKGQTVTTYPQSPTPYTTDDITYRIMMKQNKETGVISADMLIYNAKFSAMPQEPKKEAILVPDLTVEFGEDKVSITGTEVEPKVYEAGEYTPYPSFVFNKIDFHTTNDLYTQGELSYTVAGVFQGYFTGSYLDTYYMSGK